jgi:hypothetical protein
MVRYVITTSLDKDEVSAAPVVRYYRIRQLSTAFGC